MTLPVIDHDADRYRAGLFGFARQIDAFRTILLCFGGIILPFAVTQVPAVAGGKTHRAAGWLRDEGFAVGTASETLQPVTQTGYRQRPAQGLFCQDVDIGCR